MSEEPYSTWSAVAAWQQQNQPFVYLPEESEICLLVFHLLIQPPSRPRFVLKKQLQSPVVFIFQLQNINAAKITKYKQHELCSVEHGDACALIKSVLG